jgi:hypothetical protein
MAQSQSFRTYLCNFMAGINELGAILPTAVHILRGQSLDPMLTVKAYKIDNLRTSDGLSHFLLPL